MIYKMAKAKKLGRINLRTRGNTKEVRSMVKVYMCGRMAAYIVDLGLTTKFMGMELINGPMAESMLVNGKTIKCMDLVI